MQVGGNARNEVKYSLMDWNCEILVTFGAFWDKKEGKQGKNLPEN